MEYIDVTQKIFPGMKRYPSDPEVTIKAFKSLKRGDSCNLLQLSLGSHSGTHIDAPKHVFDTGSAVDELNIDNLICKVAVVELRHLRGKKILNCLRRNKIKGLLIKRKSAKLTLEDARILINNKISLVGTESLTIEEPEARSHPVHKLLLGKGIVIVENLSLRKVKPGCYGFICLPLKIAGADGAPVRAILTDNKRDVCVSFGDCRRKQKPWI